MSQPSIVPLACKVALGSHPGRRDFHSIISVSCCTVCSIPLNFSFSAFQLSALENGMISINIFSLIKMEMSGEEVCEDLDQQSCTGILFKGLSLGTSLCVKFMAVCFGIKWT